jgi:hypothetical protein
MKNMLTRTALVGSALLLGVSAVSAQTTVSGNLDLTYKAITSDKATARSYRYFGKESQINLANKGKLSNGMEYAAGFSFEIDGNDSNAPTAATENGSFAENTYIDFIAGNTTITIGADHIQNPDKSLVNLVGISDIDDAIQGVTAANKAQATPSFVATANSAYGAFGLGVVQTVPGMGKVSVNYTPDRTTGLANGDTLGSSSTNLPATYDVGNSAYEVGFVGDLGVKGLNVEAFYNKSDSGNAFSDLKGQMFGARYNTGAITVAAQRSETKSAEATVIKVTSDSFGAAYAMTKDLSIGLSYGVTDKTGTTVDEKIKQVSIGYNLGPVLVGASYAQVKDLGNVATIDGDTLVFRASTKF